MSERRERVEEFPPERVFEEQIDVLIDAARRACLRQLPWAPQEHAAIVQEAIERALQRARSGAIDLQETDLPGYVYGIARNCVQEVRRRLWRGAVRECELPEDGLLESLLGDEEAASNPALEELLRDEERRKLFSILRYAAVHVFADATEKKRRQALRDTYLLARHHLRGVPLADLAAELGLTPRACRYAVERMGRRLQDLLDRETGELRSFVENSEHFQELSELSHFLRERVRVSSSPA